MNFFYFLKQKKKRKLVKFTSILNFKKFSKKNFKIKNIKKENLNKFKNIYNYEFFIKNLINKKGLKIQNKFFKIKNFLKFKIQKKSNYFNFKKFVDSPIKLNKNLIINNIKFKKYISNQKLYIYKNYSYIYNKSLKSKNIIYLNLIKKGALSLDLSLVKINTQVFGLVNINNLYILKDIFYQFNNIKSIFFKKTLESSFLYKSLFFKSTLYLNNLIKKFYNNNITVNSFFFFSKSLFKFNFIKSHKRNLFFMNLNSLFKTNKYWYDWRNIFKAFSVLNILTNDIKKKRYINKYNLKQTFTKLNIQPFFLYKDNFFYYSNIFLKTKIKTSKKFKKNKFNKVLLNLFFFLSKKIYNIDNFYFYKLIRNLKFIKIFFILYRNENILVNLKYKILLKNLVDIYIYSELLFFLKEVQYYKKNNKIRNCNILIKLLRFKNLFLAKGI